MIESVKIIGDFFLYPGDLDLIEAKDSRSGIKDFVLNHSEAFGLDSESLTDAIVGCLNPAKQG